MRTLIRAFVVSVIVTSATFAVACPIDLAPCEEVMRPSDADVQVDQLISVEGSAVKLDAAAGEVERFGQVQEVVLINHEDDVVADGQETTGSTSSDSYDRLWDMNNSVPGPAVTEVAAVPTRKFLLEDEDLIDIDYTGTVDSLSASSSAAQPKLAIDGYEDH